LAGSTNQRFQVAIKVGFLDSVINNLLADIDIELNNTLSTNSVPFQLDVLTACLSANAFSAPSVSP
jgi:hypothetical protein